MRVSDAIIYGSSDEDSQEQLHTCWMMAGGCGWVGVGMLPVESKSTQSLDTRLPKPTAGQNELTN